MRSREKCLSINEIRDLHVDVLNVESTRNLRAQDSFRGEV